MKTAILLVTYNSEPFLDKCIAAIDAQTVPVNLIQIVDTGSKHLDYLKPFTMRPHVKFMKAEKDAGFCRGNNIGFRHLPKEIDLLILLNPDCFIPPDFIEKTISFMEKKPSCGGFSALLEKYDLKDDRPAGIIDSAGITRSWYGKWYDEKQGDLVSSIQLTSSRQVNALCGALFALRTKAANEVAFPSGDLFDPKFYMYKEDIDLSLRLTEKKWELWMDPKLIAHHCRGWNSQSRKMMPKHLRLASARNECILQWRLKSPLPILYSSLKYLAVKGLNI